MNKATLVIMAAGLGSRYGGLKQIDPVGPNGEIIIDYSVFDAVKAGFSKIVFIIKKENEAIFREVIGNKVEKIVDVDYAFQDVSDIPGGNIYGREKPWGTGHAVLCAEKCVKTPFAVINADDFYGRSAFEGLYKFLSEVKDTEKYNYAMMGFILENTLTDNGTVARGVCDLDGFGYLKNITERTKIKKFGEETKYEDDNGEWILIPKGNPVSMNTWGFTPSLFDELKNRLPAFLQANQDNILKAEYFLPSVVDALIKEDKAQVQVLKCDAKWYGVTYKEDKPIVENAIRDMITFGKYPSKLWK